jgi:hypothetical protein
MAQREGKEKPEREREDGMRNAQIHMLNELIPFGVLGSSQQPAQQSLERCAIRF